MNTELAKEHVTTIPTIRKTPCLNEIKSCFAIGHTSNNQFVFTICHLKVLLLLNINDRQYVEIDFKFAN